MNIPFKHVIRLKDLDKVKLMNRVDSKYWFHIDKLPEVLRRIKDDYFILEIDGKREMAYSTTYFDTCRNDMYILHHNGKLNRCKIRRRTYVESGISFLEIKKKNNKGRTIKSRIQTANVNLNFTEKETEFIHSSTLYNCNDLQPVLWNEFVRLTLVNKYLNERCTIDFELKFRTIDGKTNLSDLAIIELKSDGKLLNSPLAKVLRDLKIKKSGFSKYCIGRVLIDKNIKANAFKSRVRYIKKMISPNNQLKKVI
jgi:hypothetical protein